MQTFITDYSYAITAATLDMRRLGKQRVEAKQIILALENPAYGWQNHPAVKMWRGYEDNLAYYGMTVCLEWRARGYKDNCLPFFRDRNPAPLVVDKPDWITDTFIMSHRSNLIRKMPEHYKPLWPDVPDNLSYIWPVK